ncbi:MAG: exonuclease SbcCD subunit D [Thomasclavelia sp.]
MRFVHIGDIHLGKLLFQQNLLEVQADLLDQICDYLVEHNIDVLIIAGDIYDRSVPSNEAIDVLNDFLTKVVSVYHKKVLMIAGNHDSASRLQFASKLLKQEGLYIEAYPPETMEPIVIEDVNFYLLPFFKPSYIRFLFQEENLNTYHDAFAYYLSKQTIDYNKTNVLVTHQFLAGDSAVIQSDSETILNVGGSEIIGVDLVKQFDYVALGHLHASQKVLKETIRYSGSLMPYSFDEINRPKSIVDVEIDNKKVSYQLVSLKPKVKLVKISGYFEDLMANDYQGNDHDYLAIELLDTLIIPNAIDFLRTKFINVLQISYPSLNNLNNQSNITKADQGYEKMNSLELFEQFYQKMKGQQLNDQAKQIISDILLGGKKDAA